MATPEDVADACVLLASPLASYVTREPFVVDGGGQRPAFTKATRPRSEVDPRTDPA